MNGIFSRPTSTDTEECTVRRNFVGAMASFSKNKVGASKASSCSRNAGSTAVRASTVAAGPVAADLDPCEWETSTTSDMATAATRRRMRSSTFRVKKGTVTERLEQWR